VRKISTTVYLTLDQVAKLKALAALTKVPMAVYVREGLDLVLEQFEDDKENPREKEETKVEVTHAQDTGIDELVHAHSDHRLAGRDDGVVPEED
jgi:hypothetical protein